MRVFTPSWDTDGVDGGPSSITILLNWLATNNNYERWRTTNSKKVMCDEIILEMSQNGIRHRTRHNIMLKMTLLQGSHNQAYEWRSTTNGFERSIGVDGLLVNVQRHLLRICRYWDKLGPIM
ncbi:hypothetical protein PGT21_021994 [Puccinia graminis f. sp. tritici]|uniref:Uncharacterized protein n=1 Tax=Puccinia graminis f. sp. tritici TaxID=56615 RepID=A0A5B0LS49_PUCGR|nr:hypothetical protein PGTUg99_010561 [Puccinia graminis f. sp. tritici]KAA1071881.1 hypothetical protein PGT21_021994 [Puccinia graminis f. sp. tritici]